MGIQTPAITPTTDMDAAASERGRAAVDFTFDLSYLLWVLCLLKDWLLSAAEPFPYREEATVSLAVLAGLWLAFWRGGNKRTRKSVSAVATVIVATIAAASLHGLPALVAGCTGGLLWLLATLRAGAARPVLAVVTTVVLLGAAALTCGELWPFQYGYSARDMWLGTGLNSTSDSVLNQPFAIQLVSNWGLLTTVTTGLLILAALAKCAFVLCRPSAMVKGATNTLAYSGAVGVTYGLMLAARSGTPLLTAHSLAGTWAFALAIGLVGLSAAPSPVDVAREPRPSKMGQRKILLIFGAAAVVSAGVAIHCMMLRQVEPLLGNAAPPGFRSYAPLGAVAPQMIDATIAMEDHTFYAHHGFNWLAMHSALRVDLRDGSVREGGSTITQQLAKNLFLTNDRTIWRKLREAALAWELDRMLPKRRILELYLNSIDYGMGQHGVTAAASYYFHKSPAQLTLAECAVLVGIVPDPMQKGMDVARIANGEATALDRIGYFFPRRYSKPEIDAAALLPLDHVMYPYKDAWDRGATEEIPAVWHGVGFYCFADPGEPSPVPHVAYCLKQRLEGFVAEASREYGVVGIDHLGAYDDRSTRQAASVLSAHAFGQAIDISGFRFADGTRIMVSDHTQSSVLPRLLKLEVLLKKHVDVVIDWRGDPLYHNTHLHAEVRGGRKIMMKEPFAWK